MALHRPCKPQQNAFIESFKYGPSRIARFVMKTWRRPGPGCVHVCGLSVRPLIMIAGPDGVRGSMPHNASRFTAPKALRAFSIPSPTGCAITSLSTSLSPLRPVKLPDWLAATRQLRVSGRFHRPGPTNCIQWVFLEGQTCRSSRGN